MKPKPIEKRGESSLATLLAIILLLSISLFLAYSACNDFYEADAAQKAQPELAKVTEVTIQRIDDTPNDPLSSYIRHFFLNTGTVVTNNDFSDDTWKFAKEGDHLTVTKNADGIYQLSLSAKSSQAPEK
jgi:hypothetical protein